ncbi:hypothetical protein BJ742DRAFT_858001, partial [Cladochytrium replicatum]
MEVQVVLSYFVYEVVAPLLRSALLWMSIALCYALSLCLDAVHLIAFVARTAAQSLQSSAGKRISKMIRMIAFLSGMFYKRFTKINPPLFKLLRKHILCRFSSFIGYLHHQLAGLIMVVIAPTLRILLACFYRIVNSFVRAITLTATIILMPSFIFGKYMEYATNTAQTQQLVEFIPITTPCNPCKHLQEESKRQSREVLRLKIRLSISKQEAKRIRAHCRAGRRKCERQQMSIREQLALAQRKAEGLEEQLRQSEQMVEGFVKQLEDLARSYSGLKADNSAHVQQIETERSDHATQIQNMKETLSKRFTERIVRIRKQVATANAERDKFGERAAHLESEVDKVKLLVTETRAERNLMADHTLSLKAEIRDKTDRLEFKTSECMRLSNTLDERNILIKVLHEDNDLQKDGHSKEVEELKLRLSELSRENTELRKDIEVRNYGHTKEIDELKVRMSALTAENVQLRANPEMQEVVHANEIKELRQRVSELEGEKPFLHCLIQQERESHWASMAAQHEMAQQCDVLTQNNFILEAERATFAVTVENIHTAYGTQISDLTEVASSSVTLLEREREEHISSRQERLDLVNRLNEERCQFKGTLTKLQEENEKKDKHIKDISAKLLEAQQQISAMDASCQQERQGQFEASEKIKKDFQEQMKFANCERDQLNSKLEEACRANKETVAKLTNEKAELAEEAQNERNKYLQRLLGLIGGSSNENKLRKRRADVQLTQ